MNENQKIPFKEDLSQGKEPKEEIKEENIIEKLKKIYDIPVSLKVEIGHKEMSIKEFLSLGKGSIVTLDKSIDEPLLLTINNVPFAEVEILVIDSNFAVRILKILEK
ncbi:MAG: FliM/FliN family flagellar motor C-terminal domain-containing protein [bacterium]|nr:FliM/FliN family flagellar motor C-terminal domain-containing protein [bacterium]MDW8163682.1 FliM/FliN family flagellar motor C-terminal domain-containing protein [Candidatus Omnitrophota bacterium]